MMIARASSLGPAAVHTAPWDVWLLKSKTHFMLWKLSSTVCFRVCVSASGEEYHHLRFFIAFKDLFPTGSHYFFIIVLLRKNNTITLTRRQRPLLCTLWWTKLTLYITRWTLVLLSFLMTWSVLLCFMYNAVYYKKEEGLYLGMMMAFWLTEGFWILFLGKFGYPEVIFIQDQPRMSTNISYAKSWGGGHVELLQFGIWCLFT